METDLRKKAKDDLAKEFFQLVSNAVFELTMKNVRKRKGIKLVMREKRRTYLVSEPK